MDIQKKKKKKKRFKKLVTHVESHESAVSLLENGEQRYIQAINNNNNTGGVPPKQESAQKFYPGEVNSPAAPAGTRTRDLLITSQAL